MRPSFDVVSQGELLREERTHLRTNPDLLNSIDPNGPGLWLMSGDGRMRPNTLFCVKACRVEDELTLLRFYDSGEYACELTYNHFTGEVIRKPNISDGDYELHAQFLMNLRQATAADYERMAHPA